MMGNAAFLSSQQLDRLTKERDELLTTAEDLRGKLHEAVRQQQEIEAQRDAAVENISQVNTGEIHV